jgi:ABC-type antimicrobial peptide transport system permease subunit
MLICAALGGIGSILLFFWGSLGIALADAIGPSLPVPNVGSWTTWVVVLICVVVIIAVAIGVFLILRARAKRRASGPGTGR